MNEEGNPMSIQSRDAMRRFRDQANARAADQAAAQKAQDAIRAAEVRERREFGNRKRAWLVTEYDYDALQLRFRAFSKRKDAERYADLCRHRHKSAYAELRIIPALPG
jgi:hypothetical protein